MKLNEFINNFQYTNNGIGKNTLIGDIDKKQLLVGIAVEMEHTDDLNYAASIAIDHLSENENYYTTLIKCGLVDEEKSLMLAKRFGLVDNDPEASAQANAACDAEGQDNVAMGMSHLGDTTTGAESGTFGDQSEPPTHGQDPNMSDMGANRPDDDMEDVLLGFKPHNVGDDLDEEFGYEKYQGKIGDRYEDRDKNQFTVSDITKGGVGLRGQGGSKQVATSDVMKMKKLSSAVEEAYGQPDPLKIPMLPKDNKIR